MAFCKEWQPSLRTANCALRTVNCPLSIYRLSLTAKGIKANILIIKQYINAASKENLAAAETIKLITTPMTLATIA